jgi:hypothetical protein
MENIQFPLLSIDKNYLALDDDQVTAGVIDGYICLYSFNALNHPKRKEHILELVTHNSSYWERIINAADELYWLKNEGRGWAVFLPRQDCGFIRMYKFKPSKNQDIQRLMPWNIGEWKHVQSESVLLGILDSLEYVTIFNGWKCHQTKVNKVPTEFAEGRLSNTIVSKVMLVTKGNGCAVCGQYADHHATTTLSEYNTVMLSISLCAIHTEEAAEYPCILKFFGTLFFLAIDIPDLIKLDHLPDELIAPIADIIASGLNAEFDKPEKRKNGWHIVFKMKDSWSWVLRLNTLTDYAYMLFTPSGKQVHRIDSANDHPDVPFGPDHQHYNPHTRKEIIKPSFSYGIPLFDFPLMEKSKVHHKQCL